MAIIYSINNKIAVLNNKWMQKAESAPEPTPVVTYRQCYSYSQNTLNETTHVCSNCGTEFGECPECGAYAVYQQPTGYGHEEFDEGEGEIIYVDDYGNACGACGWHDWEDPDPGDDPGDEPGDLPEGWDYCPNCGEPYDGEYCGNCGYPDNEDPGGEDIGEE